MSIEKVKQFINSIPDKRAALQLLGALDHLLPTNKDTALTAHAGGTQAAALALRSDCAFHDVATVATAADSVALPYPHAGDMHFVKNSAATSMQVYAVTPGTIDSAATATGVAQLGGDGVLYVCVVDGNYVRLGGVSATEVFGAITADSITGGDSSLGITGQAAAQGGAVVTTGGTSSTTGNAGGAVSQVGGTPGATGTGGAASIVGGVSGSSGARDGGAAAVTGGAGHATSTGNGGVASITGGASGGGATGTGGAASITGGAAVSTNGDGGTVILTPGAKNGSGLAGGIALRTGTIWYKQSAATTDNADTPYTMTAAEMLGGISSMTPTTGRAVTTLTGAQIDAAVAIAGLAVDDAFEFSVQNRAAFAATDDILTLTAGASGVTVTGSAVISPGSTAQFRARRTGTATYVIHKIAG